MSQFHWRNTRVAPSGTFHLLAGKALYPHRFSQVWKYHEPGLAPARNDPDAFHIDLRGQPAYLHRFLETFGFYDGLAAVRDAQGWFHIKPNGEMLYPIRYEWCGNFQDGLCPVKDQSNAYFHIDRNGNTAYPQKYSYVGDFKDGIAVVCNENGLHTHIDSAGRLLHGKWFIDLDIFHKGFARAQDERGWFHLTKQGRAVYPQRYTKLEPFYNGAARVEQANGELLVINTNGKAVTQLRSATHIPWQMLSADMVGFWRTETIATAVKLKILNNLPGTTEEIASRSNLPKSRVERLLRALWELDVVYVKDADWHFTLKGQGLAPQERSFLAAAARMWSDVNAHAWRHLPNAIRSNTISVPSFKAHASDDQLHYYHQALDGYAYEDFSAWQIPHSWQFHQKLIGVGRTAKIWLERLLQQFPHQQAVLLGEEYIFKDLTLSPEMAQRYRLQAHSVLQAWPQKADAILLPRILHYWPNQEVAQVLTHARQALLENGKIYIFEMLLTDDCPNGSLLDLNLLAESSGKLRFLNEWQSLLSESKLELIEMSSITPWMKSLIVQAIA